MKTKFYLLNFFIFLLLISGVTQAQQLDSRYDTFDGKINSAPNTQVKKVDIWGDSQNSNFSDPQTESLSPGEGFETLPFPPTGWDTTIVNPVINTGQRWSRVAVANTGSGAFGLSFGAAKFDFYLATGGTRQYLQSPNFGATVSGEVLRFDWSYVPYIDGARDSIIIQVSSDGVNFTDLYVMWGDTTSTMSDPQNMVTGIRNSSAHTPTDAQWASKQLALPVGTVAIRIFAIAGFGNNFYIDNIVTYVPAAPMTGAFTINFANPTGGSNFQTFRDAANALNTRGISGAVTFNVSPGIYGLGNRCVINPVAGSSSTNTITFQPSGAGEVLMSDTGTASVNDYMVMLNGADWVTFDGINVRDVATVANGQLHRGYYLNAYRGIDGPKDNTIKNCKITLGGGVVTPPLASIGVLGTGAIGGTSGGQNVVNYPSGSSDNNKIQNVRVNRSDRGIGFFAPIHSLAPLANQVFVFHLNNEISNCVLGDSITIGSNLSTTGSPIGFIPQGCRNLNMFNNRVDSLRNTLVTNTGGGTGIALQISSGRIYNNRINHMFSASTTSAVPVLTGIQGGPSLGDTLFIYNNFVTGLVKSYTGAASATVGIVGLQATNFAANTTTGARVILANNTVDLNATAPVPFSSTCTSFGNTGLTYISVNNSLTNRISTTNVTSKAFVIADANPTRAFLLGNYNNLYATGTNGFIAGYSTSFATTALTLADWKTASSVDTNSVSSDVIYSSFNPLTVDGSVAGNWVINGKGIALSYVTTDINGTTRNISVTQGTTDIGADEVTMSVNPSFATESAAPSSGGTSVYMQFGDTVCIVNWGTGGTLPTGLNIMNMTGEMPPNAGSSHHFASHVNVSQVGGPLSGTTYDMTLKYGHNQLFNITGAADIRLAKQDGTFWNSYLAAGTGAGQSDLNDAGRRVTVRGLNSFSNFTATDPTAPLNTVGLAPNLLFPLNNATNVIPNNPKTFNWNKSIEGVQRPTKSANAQTDNVVSGYWFEFYADTTAAPVALDSTLTDTTFTYAPTLPQLTPYWWRVRAKNENGWGPFASYFKFTTDLTSGLIQTSEIPTVYDLFQNYPNPFNPTTKIKFDIPQSGFVSLKVFDITGREVATLVNNNLEASRYEVTWNGAQFGSGVYFFRIQAGDFVKVQKMILTK